MPPKKQPKLIEEAFKKIKLWLWPRSTTSAHSLSSQFRVPISQNSAELSQLTEDFKTKGSMARFRENDVPGAFLDLKRDLAWWHTTMLDFVKLNTDPQHTQIDRWLGPVMSPFIWTRRVRIHSWRHNFLIRIIILVNEWLVIYLQILWHIWSFYLKICGLRIVQFQLWISSICSI